MHKSVAEKIIFATRNSFLGVSGNAEGAKDDITPKKGEGSLNNERIAFLFVAITKTLDDVYHHTWQQVSHAVRLNFVLFLSANIFIIKSTRKKYS